MQIRTIKIGPPDITSLYFPANTSSQFWWVGTYFAILGGCDISHWVWILFDLSGFSSDWVCVLFERWWPTLTLWWRLRFGTNRSLDRWENNSFSNQSKIDFFYWSYTIRSSKLKLPERIRQLNKQKLVFSFNNFKAGMRSRALNNLRTNFKCSLKQKAPTRKIVLKQVANKKSQRKYLFKQID